MKLFESTTARYIVKRILQAIPVLWGVTFILFALLNLLPGGIVQTLLAFSATPTLKKELTIRLGLNQPFFERYFHWLGGVLSGHLGNSLVSGQPVSSILAQRLPVTFELSIIALVLSVVLAVPVAVLAARHPRGAVDRLNIVVSMFGFSCPAFVFGLILVLVFAVHARILPALGFVPLSKGLLPNLRSLVLPAATLSFGLFCGYTRLLRADIIEQMTSEDYVVTARAKGVPYWRTLIRHALRNSIFGLITVVSLNLGTLIGGSVLVEQIFGLPGMGQELLQSINNRDFIVVQAIVLLLATTVVLANLAADLVYGALDPRIRHGRPVT